MSSLNLFKNRLKGKKWDKISVFADLVCIVQIYVFVDIFAKDQSILMQLLLFSMATLLILSLNALPPRQAMAARMGILILIVIKLISISGSLYTSAAVNAAYGQSHVLEMEAAQAKAELTREQAQLLRSAGIENQRAASTSLSGVCKTSHDEIMAELSEESSHIGDNNPDDIKYLND